MVWVAAGAGVAINPGLEVVGGPGLEGYGKHLVGFLEGAGGVFLGEAGAGEGGEGGGAEVGGGEGGYGDGDLGGVAGRAAFGEGAAGGGIGISIGGGFQG